jgi:hypothetical protein
MEMTEFMFEGIFSSIVGIIGAVGNLAAIVYYQKRRSNLKSTFHGLMMALAAYDLIIIFSVMMLISMPKLFCDFKGTRFYQNLAPWILFISHIGLEGSIYLTVAITVERYLVICQPIFYRSKWWPTKLFVIPITCFAIIFCIPKLFELETKEHYKINHVANFTNDAEIIKQCMIPLHTQQFNASAGHSANACATWFKIQFSFGGERLEPSSNCSNNKLDELFEKLLSKSSITTLVPTQLRQNPCYYQIYIVWLNIIFNAVLPFVVLIVLNSYILHYLILNERRGSSRVAKKPPLTREESSRLRIHHHPSQRRKRETKVSMAKVSLAIVFVFIICHSIRWIPNIYEFFWVS